MDAESSDDDDDDDDFDAPATAEPEVVLTALILTISHASPSYVRPCTHRAIRLNLAPVLSARAYRVLIGDWCVQSDVVPNSWLLWVVAMGGCYGWLLWGDADW